MVASVKRAGMYEFVGCAASNFCRGRPFGFRPEGVVVHTMGATLADREALFRRPGSCKSTHYGVSRAGEVHQYVDENDSAFHAGIVVNPTWTLLKPRVNPNFYTIGIAHEGMASQVCTEEQLCASAKLIGEIAERWAILLDERHVIGHQQIRASRQCPGSSLAISELLRRVPTPAAKVVAAAVGGTSGTSHTNPFGDPPAVSLVRATEAEVVVYPNGQKNLANPVECSGAANGDNAARNAAADKPVVVRTLCNVKLRKSKATIRAQLVRVIPAFTDVVVSGFELGEPLEGNAYWYVDVQGNFFWAGATNVPDPTVLELQ